MLKYGIFKKLSNFFTLFLILLSFLFLLINPSLNMKSFLDGIILWANYVMPALFPILFLTSLLNFSGITSKVGKIFSPITKKLFNCSGVAGYIYLMSILSGYPVGAKITSELFEKGTISYGEACRITSFTSTSGPLFIIGTVGVGMMENLKAGIIILLSHMIGATINGIIFRNLYVKSKYEIMSIEYKRHENILENSMLSSIKSVLIIGGFIAFAYMFISILDFYNVFESIDSTLSNILNVPKGIIGSILKGMLEMTRGCRDLSLLNLNENIKTILTTLIITLGGISIFLQAYTYLAKFKIKLKLYFLEKILHTALSCAICSILVTIF